MSLLQYIDGDYQDPATFTALRAMLGAARHPIHYLAIPPSMFATVVEGLNSSGCANGARVIVEKPFGRDLASAHETMRLCIPRSRNPSFFRIDHYLGKEAVENLLLFRFANTFLEPIWNRNYVTACRSRWPNPLAWTDAANSMTKLARFATWCKTISFRSLAFSPWSRRRTCIPIRCAMSR